MQFAQSLRPVRKQRFLLTSLSYTPQTVKTLGQHKEPGVSPETAQAIFCLCGSHAHYLKDFESDSVNRLTPKQPIRRMERITRKVKAFYPNGHSTRDQKQLVTLSTTL